MNSSQFPKGTDDSSDAKSLQQDQITKFEPGSGTIHPNYFSQTDNEPDVENNLSGEEFQRKSFSSNRDNEAEYIERQEHFTDEEKIRSYDEAEEEPQIISKKKAFERERRDEEDEEDEARDKTPTNFFSL